MSRLVAVFILAGCMALTACGRQSRPNPVRQEASCERDAKSFVTLHEQDDAYEKQDEDMAERIELCMRSKGYNLDQKEKECVLTKFDAFAIYLRNSNPACYSPPS